MRAPKLTNEQWLDIKTKYQMGNNLREIALEYNYDAGNISKRAKREGWVHGELKEITNTRVDGISKAIDIMIANDEKMKELSTEAQKNCIAEEILRRLGLANLADEVQTEVMMLTNEVAKQAREVVKNNPSGFYVKSQGENGITYGKNTELVKDMTPIINGINQKLNPNSQIAIQNNQQINNETQDKKVIINIQGIE